MYRSALLHSCNYAYTVNVNENRIHSLYNAGFLNQYNFYADQPYDQAMQRMVDTMKPVILLGRKEFHLTSHYIAAYEQGNHVVEVEYYIPDADAYKKKTIFLFHDEKTDVLYACVVAHDVTAMRKQELETGKALTQLTEVAVKAGNGDLDVEVDVNAPGEVGVLADVLRQTLMNLKWHVNQLRQQATKDALTGVKNKGAWMTAEARLNDEIANGSACFALAVCDINYLKELNDHCGHEAGDDLIRRCCHYICTTFKHSPVFRIGGDEFVVILERSDLEQKDELIRQFRKGMNHQEPGIPNQPPVSVALGLSSYQPETDTCCADVFRRADAAMYENKAVMKNR